MSNNLSALEEFDAQRKIQFPHLLSGTADLRSQKIVAYDVLTRKNEELFLMSPSAFGEASAIAGLTEQNIEYFTKNAPIEYKKRLITTMLSGYGIEEAWEVVRAMDEDFGDGQTQNQNRLGKVLQYIQDNRVVFQV
jgi:hypothetical protein